jgi:predicted transcriptional regulator
MPREALLLSVRPVFVDRILDGTKTVELRRVRPDVVAGQNILIYSSTPTMALLASAIVARVDVSDPENLWQHVRHAAGVSKAEYAAYFTGAGRAAAIWLSHVRALSRPIALRELRERWPWFRPPQSYCYVRASVDLASRSVTSLAPRG